MSQAALSFCYSRTNWLRLLFLSFISTFVLIAWLKYASLHSYYFDLGIFQNWLFNVAYYHQWTWIFHGHVQIFSLPYLWLLKIVPSDYDVFMLLLLQSLALSLPGYFLYKKFGLFVSVVYAIYPILWINNHFEFHFDHLVVPLMLWFYLAVSNEKVWQIIVAGASLMLVKEPFALQTVGCGVFLLLYGLKQEKSKRLQWTASGFFLIGIGLLYFYFCTKFVIPYFTHENAIGIKADAFSWLGNSLLSIVQYVTLNPLYILKNILSTQDKLLYLLVIFAPLMFVSLLSPTYLVPALPILVIAMLSQDPTYYNCHKHYAVGAIIPVIVAFAHGLPLAQKLFYHAERYVGIKNHFKGSVFNNIRGINILKGAILLVVLSSHVILAPSPFSLWFWSNKLWAYNWKAYHPSDRDEVIKHALLTQVPANPDMTVVVQTSVNFTNLSHHKVYMSFPDGIETPIITWEWPYGLLTGFWHFLHSAEKPKLMPHYHYADYVIIDLKRPWFIGDQSCRWHYDHCSDRRIANQFLNWVMRTKIHYQTIFEYDGFAIMKRV